MQMTLTDSRKETARNQSECPHCTRNEKLLTRDFSDQAWSFLVIWGEIEKKTVGKPICDDCWSELREVLIDRADELNQEDGVNYSKTGKKAS